MDKNIILKAENLLLRKRYAAFNLELREAEGALVIERDLDFLRLLMKCCLGLEQAKSGSISWWAGTKSFNSDSWELYDFFRHVAYIDRQSQLLDALTLNEHFNLLKNYALDSDLLNKADELLNVFNLKAYRNYPAGDLPEPQRRLALYALALCRGPRLLLVERPYQFLERDFKNVWGYVLNSLENSGLAYIIFDRDESIYSKLSFNKKFIFKP